MDDLLSPHFGLRELAITEHRDVDHSPRAEIIPHLNPRRLATALCVALLGLQACTVVHIEDARSGKVEVERHFGILSLELRPGTEAIVESTSFGLVNTYGGMAIGYHSASLATLGPGTCRVVLWIRSDEQLKELRELLRERADVCVSNPDEELRRKR
jgi:hypothetical protein